MLVILWRSVAGLMWLAFAVGGAVAGGLVGSLIGLVVSEIYEQFAGFPGKVQSLQMFFYSAYVGFAAGGVMGIYWATRLWLKSLHPVMGNERPEVQPATASV